MGKGELAEELFLKGYNCAQAVAGAFAEDIGMDFDTAVKTVSSFGGGMGRLREVCGAVSGMFFVAALPISLLVVLGGCKARSLYSAC